jgi:DNA-binding response OmpR family regulator
MNILLVEDDFDLGEMYGLQLKKAGHRVTWVRDAQSALDYLDDNSVEIVLLDILLPANNGLNVLYELRSYPDWRKIPVFILSSIAAVELGASPEMLKKLGVRKYLVKSETKPEQLCQELDLLKA